MTTDRETGKGTAGTIKEPRCVCCQGLADVFYKTRDVWMCIDCLFDRAESADVRARRHVEKEEQT